MQFSTAHQEFIFDCQLRKLTPKTIKGYTNTPKLLFNYIYTNFGVTDIEEVTAKQIKEYIKELLANGRKPTYTNGVLKILKSFFNYCSNEGYIITNPTKNIKYASEGTVIIKTFSDSEIKRLIVAFKPKDYLTTRNRTIIMTLIDTGIRANELCELRTTDINNGYMKIQGKGNKERIIGITPFLSKNLFKYQCTREAYFKYKNIPNNYFLSRTGKPLTVGAVENVVKKACILANVRNNIRCSPHTLRHYFAQAQLRNNLDIYSLSRLLGHDSIRTTQRYLQSIEDLDIIDRSLTTSPLMNLF